jgi:hypothetical protein
MGARWKEEEGRKRYKGKRVEGQGRHVEGNGNE